MEIAPPKIYSARTAEDIEKLSEEHGFPLVLAQLNDGELESSASRWSYRHLIAYRLLTNPEKPFLETFEADHDSQCPVCRPDEACLQKIDIEKTKAIVEEDCPCSLYKSTESELMQLPEGFFWTALARTCRELFDDDSRVRPQRDRKPVIKEGYVNSTTAIDGSSSPTTSSGSEEFDLSIASIENLDEDEHEALRSKPEDITVHLIGCFLQYALNFSLRQDPNGNSEILPRQSRQISKALIGGVDGITAEDDGGIRKMVRHAHGWKQVHSYLALIEAKRAFKYVYYNERTGKLTPVVSNATLAQYLGEAVITWKANQDDLVQDIFLLAATGPYLRFIHFHFGLHYEEYIDATDEASQKAVASQWGQEACVHMRVTKWFNLASANGRRGALCHILALLRWHDAQDAEVQIDDIDVPDMEDDSEYMGESSEDISMN